MRTTTRVGVLVVVLASVVGSATAAQLSGGFDRDGFDAYYSLRTRSSGTKEYASFSADLASEAHQIDYVSISIQPDYWGWEGEGKTRFLISGSFGGTRNRAPALTDLSSSLSFAKAGVEYYQSENLNLSEWDDNGVSHSESYGSIYAEITGAKWDHLSVNYSEWTDDEGGGKGVVGVASLTDPITTFNWSFQAHGYFDDPIRGAQFLGAVPEPASVVLLSLLAAGMKFRRRCRQRA